MIQHDVDPEYNAEVFSIELDIEPLLECLLHHPHLPDEIVFLFGLSIFTYSTITRCNIISTTTR